MLSFSQEFPNGIGMNRNSVTRKIHPVTSPIASGLKFKKTNKIETLRALSENRLCTTISDYTYIFGRVRLLRSWPNRFAFTNMSLSPGMNCFVITNAHVDNIAFTSNGICISVGFRTNNSI